MLPTNDKYEDNINICDHHEGKITNAYKILIRKPDRKTPLGRPRHRWEDTRIDHTEIGREGVDWIQLALVGTSGECF